jgi:hypothetical protein
MAALELFQQVDKFLKRITDPKRASHELKSGGLNRLMSTAQIQHLDKLNTLCLTYWYCFIIDLLGKEFASE